MDIRIEVKQLKEGGFRAYIYDLKKPVNPLEADKGEEIYANTAPQEKAKMLTRLSGMIDALLPAEKPKEK